MGNTPSKGPSGDPTTSKLNIPISERRRRSSNNSEASSGKLTREYREQAAAQSASNQRHQSSSYTADVPSRNNPDKSDKKAPSRAETSEQSNPVQVPYSQTDAERNPYPSLSPSGPPLNTYYGASAHLQRPPRLPLPIGDASTAPGSPIVGPDGTTEADLQGIKNIDEQARPGVSDFNGAAVYDDETSDGSRPHNANRAVPTTIDWNGPGNKVYVTGTFVDWEKKFRLHRTYVISCINCYLNFFFFFFFAQSIFK